MTWEFTVEQAMNALHGTDEETRIAAINWLTDRGHTPAVPAMITLMNECDPGTAYMIAQALGKLGDPAAVPALLDALRGSDPWTRMAVTGALIRFGEAAVDGLVEGLLDENAAVRRAAAKALGKIGSAEHKAVRGLSAALLDIDSGVRRFAAEALGRLGDGTVVPELSETLRDADTNTRIAAFKALARLDTPEAAETIRRWVREQ
jgi:HEAT repeat protein